MVVGAPRCSEVHLKANASVQTTPQFDHPAILVQQLSNTPRASLGQNYILLMLNLDNDTLQKCTSIYTHSLGCLICYSLIYILNFYCILNYVIMFFDIRFYGCDSIDKHCRKQQLDLSINCWDTNKIHILCQWVKSIKYYVIATNAVIDYIRLNYGTTIDFINQAKDLVNTLLISDD